MGTHWEGSCCPRGWNPSPDLSQTQTQPGPGGSGHPPPLSGWINVLPCLAPLRCQPRGHRTGPSGPVSTRTCRPVPVQLNGEGLFLTQGKQGWGAQGVHGNVAAPQPHFSAPKPLGKTGPAPPSAPACSWLCCPGARTGATMQEPAPTELGACRGSTSSKTRRLATAVAHARKHASTLTYTCVHRHACTRTRACAHPNMHTVRKCMPVHAPRPTHARTPTRGHTCTRTVTHAHTHTQAQAPCERCRSREAAAAGGSGAAAHA